MLCSARPAAAAGWQDVRSVVAMRGLASDGSSYVAAASNGIWTSTDLVTWNKVSLPAGAGELYDDVVWDGTRFIAVGEGIIDSPDGVTWTVRVKPTATRFFWNAIAFSGGVYVVVGNDGTQVLRSTDGVTWTAQATGLSNSSTGGAELTGVASDGTGFVVSGNLYTLLGPDTISPDSDIMLSSPDGVTWTQQTLPGGTGEQFDQSLLSDVAFGAGVYVAGGVGGVYTSPDGVTWTSVSLAAGSDFPIMSRISFVNGEFVAAGIDSTAVDNAAVFTSNDGVHWSTQLLGPSGASIYSMSTVAFNAGRYIVGGYQGIYTSSDAATWTKKFTGPQTNLAGCVLTGGGKIVVPGAHGALTSSDGSSWPDSPSSATTLFGSLDGKGCGAFGAGVFVAVTGSHTSWSSAGVTWTAASSGPALRFAGVAWTGSKFVAIGTTTASPSTTAVATSTDGKNWTAAGSVSVPSGTLQFGAAPNFSGALAYLNGQLVTWGTVDGVPFVSISADGGHTWSASGKGLGAAAELGSVAYGDGLYVAVGNDSAGDTTLFTSKDAKSWTRVSGVASGTSTHWNSAVWGNAEFMVVGADATTGAAVFLTSRDGKTWTFSTTAASAGPYDVA
ncbi:MAG TPA: hypothetical protein VGH71_08805, partial [Gammaproteobacteria bacterium]